jgi:DNA polymerase III subunit gamma/tau
MVFYRKYRPQKIDDLDNAQLRETLTSVLIKSPAHAYLFTGPKGLGKTSTARIVAKVINCVGRVIDPTNFETIEPCNTCEQCNSITDGTNLDVLEIDAASNRGIDEIRDLKDKIRLAPLSAKKKVYIIDEVHMLTTEAFNALLKTLEEPPSHALFILCTTEPHKIPATIFSRCFHVTFTKATDDELVRAFGRIVKGENLTIASDALEQIAHLADGGFRDGVKMLEEVVALSRGEAITKSLIDEKLHISSTTQKIHEFLKSLADKDTKEGLSVVKALSDEGVDMKFFLEQLIDILHSLLLTKVGIDKHTNKLADAFTVGDIRQLFQLFSKAYSEMRYAILPQLPVELALIEWASATPETSTPETQALSEDVSTLTAEVKKAENSLVTLRKRVGDIEKQKILHGQKTETKDKDDSEPTATGVSILKFNASGEPTPEWLDELWKNIIIRMKDYNHTIAGVMRGCQLKSFDRKTVVIETAYKFHKERLEEAKTLTQLEKIVTDLTGSPTAVQITLKGKK